MYIKHINLLHIINYILFYRKYLNIYYLKDKNNNRKDDFKLGNTHTHI